MMTRLISQKKLDYSVVPEIKSEIKAIINQYDDNLEVANKVINYDDYSLYPTQNYGIDLDMPRATGVYRSRTERLCLTQIDADVGRIQDAKRMVNAVDNGILRASRTVDSPAKQLKMQNDLRDSFIGRKKTGRRSATLSEYKERAIYFMAVELGLVEIDKDIFLAERQRCRIFGYAPAKNGYE